MELGGSPVTMFCPRVVVQVILPAEKWLDRSSLFQSSAKARKRGARLWGDFMVSSFDFPLRPRWGGRSAYGADSIPRIFRDNLPARPTTWIFNFLCSGTRQIIPRTRPEYSSVILFDEKSSWEERIPPRFFYSLKFTSVKIEKPKSINRYN